MAALLLHLLTTKGDTMPKPKPFQVKHCPRCNKDYKAYPALSRYDNFTLICPACGNAEAFETFGKKRGELTYPSYCRQPQPTTKENK
jgi:hypothetical protein